LLLAFFFADSYHLIREDYFTKAANKQFIKMIVGAASFLFFIFALINFYLLAGILIEVKKLMMQKNNSNKTNLFENDDVGNFLELEFAGNVIQENHKDCIFLTPNRPLSICLNNTSKDHLLSKIELKIIFPSKKIKLTSSEKHKELKLTKEKEYCKQLIWQVNSLTQNQNIYTIIKNRSV
jgi:hypothetical protein